MPAVTYKQTKNTETRRVLISLTILFSIIAMSMLTSVKAQQPLDIEVVEEVVLDQAELDRILAPIALYPDSLLSQILVASTYPLEVVQATRWRQANPDLNEDQVLSAVEDMSWDPSVKALTPFADLLNRISDDLYWLQSIGDAFLQNEDQVLASVQNLRQKAYDNGSIADNDYYDVTEQDDNIVIESTQREIVYVPYYDTRVVYGDWWWDGYRPTYWDRPRGYVSSRGGYYWNTNYYIRPNIFFGGFHWGTRRLVVNQYYYDNPYRYDHYGRSIHVSNYRNWSHNPVHRGGVRYPQKAVKNINNTNRSVINNRSVLNKSQRNATSSGQRSSSVASSRSSGNLRTRHVNANKVQQKLIVNKQQSVKSAGAVVDRRQSVRTGVNSTNRTVNSTNRTVNRTVNRTISTNAKTTKSTAPASRVVTTNRQSSAGVKQRVVNQNSNRAATTYQRALPKAAASTSNSSRSVSKAPQRPTVTTQKTTNRGKWSR